MPLVMLDALPRGQVLVNTDRIAYAVETGVGSRIVFYDATIVDVPHDLVQLRRDLEGDDSDDDDEPVVGLRG